MTVNGRYEVDTKMVVGWPLKPVGKENLPHLLVIGRWEFIRKMLGGRSPKQVGSGRLKPLSHPCYIKR